VKRFGLVVTFVAALAVIVIPSAGALAFADQPCVDTSEPSGLVLVCPSGTVGAPYDLHLEAKANSGNGPPYSFVLQGGALPSGLSLNSDGHITGTPTRAGGASFGVLLIDNADYCLHTTPQTCAWREFSIDIQPRVLVTTQSAPGGTVSTAYNLQLQAQMMYGPGQLTPSSQPFAWSFTGDLPPGLSFDAATGLLSGTPTTAGAYLATYKAALPDGRFDTKPLQIVVRDPIVISRIELSARGSEIGTRISTKLAATGGAGTYTWTLSAGSLPAGVTLGKDGALAGTPRTSGKFTFTARAADAEGRTATLSQTLLVAPKLGFKTVKLKIARVGKVYSATLKTLGGVAPVKWKVLGGKLPRGIRFRKTLGVFSGTAEKAGTYRVSVEATDALGVKSKKTFVLVVKGA
jgi:large repetitive protein